MADDEKLFALVVREAFNHRRKTLRAILKIADFACGHRTPACGMGLNPLARPETLSVQDFVTLANGIAANGIAGKWLIFL